MFIHQIITLSCLREYYFLVHATILFFFLKRFCSQTDAEPGWDVEDADLEIPDLGPTPSAAAGNANYVHLPTNGTSPAATWIKNSQLAADHAMAGSFETACRLLNEQVRITHTRVIINIPQLPPLCVQIGVVNFKPYKDIFMNMYCSSKTTSTWQQKLVTSSFHYVNRISKDSTVKGNLPVVYVKLVELVQRLQVCSM